MIKAFWSDHKEIGKPILNPKNLKILNVWSPGGWRFFRMLPDVRRSRGMEMYEALADYSSNGTQTLLLSISGRFNGVNNISQSHKSYVAQWVKFLTTKLMVTWFISGLQSVLPSLGYLWAEILWCSTYCINWLNSFLVDTQKIIELYSMYKCCKSNKLKLQAIRPSLAWLLFSCQAFRWLEGWVLSSFDWWSIVVTI